MATMRPEDWTPQGIGGLEDRAMMALRETDGSVCVTAGAGAGKTELLAQKAAYLLQTGLCPAPRRVLAISFKRDAATTLAERVRLRIPEAQSRRFVSLNFDAWTKGLLDRFRRALPTPYAPPADYAIGFPGRDEQDAFLRRVGSSLNRQQLENLVAHTRLPVGSQPIPPAQREILRAWWRQQYEAQDHPVLTFAMINRLAEFLVRTNPAIRDALRATYPFVFLDEFQDTTYAQFELVTTAFDPARSRVTTVGDDKQRIMGWANAMADGFGTFVGLFGARRIQLLSNWRSHEDLVEVQRIVARRIDPQVEPVLARKAKAVDGAHSAIWAFESMATEVDGVADWLASEVAGGLEPHRIALLVRMNVHVVERQFGPALAARGVRLRNLARVVGGIAIEDLLGEDLTAAFLPFLHLGTGLRSPDAWSDAVSKLNSLRPAHDDDGAADRVMQRVERLSRTLRIRMAAAAPAAGQAEGIVSMLLDGIGEAAIRQGTSAYHRDADFARVRTGFTELLEECLSEGGTWASALDRFEGRGQVPLLTIHKSKGQEYHTMVFPGLDAESWRSLRETNGEELNSFYVALTRAEQRAFFTCCTERGRAIGWLEALLGDRVPRMEGGPAVHEAFA
jgi:superfamily I DNA/RNA helicase